MKKRIAILLILALCCSGAAMAAEWGEGLSAAKPAADLPEVDLTTTMGFTLLYPNFKFPANSYAKILRIYLPREDVELGSGKAQLFTEAGAEVASADFSDPNAVSIRKLSETEMNGLRWGGGVVIEIHLPISLTLGQNYYVFMDEGCFSALDGALPNKAVQLKEAWRPVVNGDFGVSNLFYHTPQPAEEPDEESDEDAEAGADTQAEAAEETRYVDPSEYKLVPEVGDEVDFDLTLGGDAVSAVLYSDNGSMTFSQIEYTEDAHIVGTVVGDELSWGVVFLDGDGNVVRYQELNW